MLKTDHATIWFHTGDKWLVSTMSKIYETDALSSILSDARQGSMSVTDSNFATSSANDDESTNMPRGVNALARL